MVDELDGLNGFGGIDGFSRMMKQINKMTKPMDGTLNAVEAAMKPFKDINLGYIPNQNDLVTKAAFGGISSFINDSNLYHNSIPKITAPPASIVDLLIGYENSKSFVKGYENSKSFIKGYEKSIEISNNVLAFNYPWKDLYSDKYFQSPAIINSNNIFDLIISFDSKLGDIIQKINPNLPKSTIKDGLLASINIDIERNSSSSEEILNDLLDNASNFVEETNQGISNFYEVFNNFLIRLFDNNKSFLLTKEYLKHLSFELMTALILSAVFPQEATVNGNQANNNTNITNNTETTNVTNNVTNVQNITNIYVGDKVITTNSSGLTPAKDRRYKNLIDIPVGAQLTVIQSSRVWLLVTYIDDKGLVHIGYISKEKFN